MEATAGVRPPRPAGRVRRRGEIAVLLGAPVVFEPWWLLVSPLVGWWLFTVVPGRSAAQRLVTTCVVLVLYLVSVAVHELAHAAVASAFGRAVGAIHVTWLGGYVEIDLPEDEPTPRLLIAGAGPMANLVLAVILGMVSDPVAVGRFSHAVDMASGMNLVIGVCNLVPALPLDGGRMLEAATHRATGSRHVAAGFVAVVGASIGLLVIRSGMGSGVGPLQRAISWATGAFFVVFALADLALEMSVSLQRHHCRTEGEHDGNQCEAA